MSPIVQSELASSSTISGLLLLDKPENITSHFVVSSFKKTLKTLGYKNTKIGHLGTLDPFASGLLPIMIGGVTRLNDELIGHKKQYLFEITLGQETDTLDCQGQIICEKPIPALEEVDILKIIPKFKGEISQVPPAYSALKMNGRPLYEFMRVQGELPQCIESKTRNIFIYDLDLISFRQGSHKLLFRVVCGKGTYIRSLARDLAKCLGTVGFCSSLRREFVEPWWADNAVIFDSERLWSLDELQKNLMSWKNLLIHLPRIKIPSVHEKLFSAGNVVSFPMDDFFAIELSKNENFSFCFAHNEEENLVYFSKIFIEGNMVIIKPSKKIV